ncbi:hypothetical protein K1I48_24215 [Bacillus licheniformis]|uniref:hypothetical protein n=1 Tax=Bacillus licheniformis TaxID=1402 RepID=UPI001C641384|nr:hypothetical protein [Bacillus licheniformis]MBW7636524.1 hypothetical protein [Bacillus licheniformis]
MAENNQNSKLNVLHLFVPVIISGIFLSLFYLFKIDHHLNNFDKVLEGATNFSSILLGFLGALLGILLSIKDSEIVKTIFSQKGTLWLKYYFYESFVTGLSVVILSSIMHIFIDDKTAIAKILFYIWFFCVVFFIFSTYRIVNILMTVFFKVNDSNASVRPEGNRIEDEAEREAIRNRLSNRR